MELLSLIVEQGTQEFIAVCIISCQNPFDVVIGSLLKYSQFGMRLVSGCNTYLESLNVHDSRKIIIIIYICLFDLSVVVRILLSS